MAGACVKREDGVTICAECVYQNAGPSRTAALRAWMW